MGAEGARLLAPRPSVSPSRDQWQSQWQQHEPTFRESSRASSQWRGRAGFAPASVSPFGRFSCAGKLCSGKSAVKSAHASSAPVSRFGLGSVGPFGNANAA